MSEEQFETQNIFDKVKEFMLKNQENLIIIALVLIVVGGVWAYMQAPQQPSTSGLAGEIGSTSTDKSTDKSKEVAQASGQTGNETKNTGTDSAAVTSASNNSVTETDEAFTVKAEKSEGITHLARKALKEYLTKTNSETNINKEQKIYVEDYLKKHTAAQKLKVGTELSFSKNLIKEAVDKAGKLTPQQQKNLEKYSTLVKNL